MSLLSRDFFARDTVSVAHDLLGHELVVRFDDQLLSGIITETEAYTADDPASHSFIGYTTRNRTMFGPPGHLYVYLIYGMYFCANVVTDPEGIGAAVLLRGIRPTAGIDIMSERRKHAKHLANGPGKLCQALGIDRSWEGLDLCDPASRIVIAESPLRPESITATPRIGITKAKDRLWRFVS